MAKEYLSDSKIQCSMTSSLKCDESIDGPSVIGTMGNGIYDVKTVKVFTEVAKELGLPVRIAKPGEKSDKGTKVDRGFRAIYVGYYKPEQNTEFWNKVHELEAQANN